MESISFPKAWFHHMGPAQLCPAVFRFVSTQEAPPQRLAQGETRLGSPQQRFLAHRTAVTLLLLPPHAGAAN